MKTCPSCSFLMNDNQDRCGHCASDADRRSVLDSLSVADTGILMPGGGGGTAVLAPPRVAPMPETVRFRSSGPKVNPKALMSCIPLLALAVAVAGWAGLGPLAPQFADWGLTRSTGVLSAAWSPFVEPSGAYEVSMPSGATDVVGLLDPANPAGGALVGKHVDGAEGASVEVVYTDFALGPGGLAAYESQQGVSELGARFMAAHMSGRQTVCVMPWSPRATRSTRCSSTVTRAPHACGSCSRVDASTH